MGRKSVCHYRETLKHPVFSHDELICKMVAQPNGLDLSLLLLAAKDADTMIQDEERLRRNLREIVSVIINMRVRVMRLVASNVKQECAMPQRANNNNNNNRANNNNNNRTCVVLLRAVMISTGL